MKTFLVNGHSVDMLAKKRVDSSNENMLSCEKDIFAHNINRPVP